MLHLKKITMRPLRVNGFLQRYQEYMCSTRITPPWKSIVWLVHSNLAATGGKKLKIPTLLARNSGRYWKKKGINNSDTK